MFRRLNNAGPLDMAAPLWSSGNARLGVLDAKCTRTTTRRCQQRSAVKSLESLQAQGNGERGHDAHEIRLLRQQRRRSNMGPKGTLMFAVMLAAATVAFLVSGSGLLALLAVAVLYPISFWLL